MKRLLAIIISLTIILSSIVIMPIASSAAQPATDASGDFSLDSEHTVYYKPGSKQVISVDYEYFASAIDHQIKFNENSATCNSQYGRTIEKIRHAGYDEYKFALGDISSGTSSAFLVIQGWAAAPLSASGYVNKIYAQYEGSSDKVYAEMQSTSGIDTVISGWGYNGSSARRFIITVPLICGASMRFTLHGELSTGEDFVLPTFSWSRGTVITDENQIVTEAGGGKNITVSGVTYPVFDIGTAEVYYPMINGKPVKDFTGTRCVYMNEFALRGPDNTKDIAYFDKDAPNRGETVCLNDYTLDISKVPTDLFSLYNSGQTIQFYANGWAAWTNEDGVTMKDVVIVEDGVVYRDRADPVPGSGYEDCTYTENIIRDVGYNCTYAYLFNTHQHLTMKQGYHWIAVMALGSDGNYYELQTFYYHIVNPESLQMAASLTEDINLKFKFGIDGSDISYKISMNDGEYEDITLDDKGIYEQAITAKQMTDEFTVVAYDSLLAADNPFSLKAKATMSVKKYAEKLVADNNSYEDKMDALLEYGAMAQKYFEYNTENLASDVVPTGLSEDAETAQYDTAFAHGTELEGKPYYGLSLVLKNKIALKFYYGDGNDYVKKEYTLKYSELNNAMPYCILAVNSQSSSDELVNLCYALSDLYSAFKI